MDPYTVLTIVAFVVGAFISEILDVHGKAARLRLRLRARLRSWVKGPGA